MRVRDRAKRMGPTPLTQRPIVLASSKEVNFALHIAISSIGIVGPVLYGQCRWYLDLHALRSLWAAAAMVSVANRIFSSESSESS